MEVIYARFGCLKPRFLKIATIALGIGYLSLWSNSQVALGQEGPSIGTMRPPLEGTIELHVQLSPAMVGAAMHRCIRFEFHEDCGAPIQCSVAMAFDNPLAGGVGTAALEVGDSCPVDIARVFAVTAIDPLHTLRSIGELEHTDGALIARFEGDPVSGGHWLVGGNLDAWNATGSSANAHSINIIDFGLYLTQFMQTYPDGSTACGTIGPHADINGDAVVDSLDLQFIIDNFLSQSQTVTCSPLAASMPPLDEISLEELISQGLGELAVADLNGDGWVNVDDMLLFASMHTAAVVP